MVVKKQCDIKRKCGSGKVKSLSANSIKSKSVKKVLSGCTCGKGMGCTCGFKSKDDVFASFELGGALPKYEMPLGEADGKNVYQVIKDELMMDGNSRQNLATFCQTWLDKNIHKIMDDCIDKNMIDKDEYPQTAEIENRCVHIMAKLWHSPDAKDTYGCSTTGSSEAAMLGGLALKFAWRNKRKAMGKKCDKPNLVCGPVQVCWHKFCCYFDVEIREVPMRPDRLYMSPESILDYVDENTIGVVPTLGLTYTGFYEDVKGICIALDKYQKKTGIDIPVHVDAASGGFIAPFCQPNLLWDFKLKRVKSINASGHKFGLAPLGCGWVVWREKQDLPEDLIFWVNYLGSEQATFALNFSRPAGQIVAQYYNFLRLGYEGYRKIHNACYDVCNYLVFEIKKIKIFDFIYDGKGGMPAVTFQIKFEYLKKLSFSAFDISDRMRMFGWLLPAYTMAPKAESVVALRMLVKHGFSMDMANLFVNDLKRAIEDLEKKPVKAPSEEATLKFNHTGK